MSFDHTVKAGTTSKQVEFVLRDSSTGQGYTGLTSSDVNMSYFREGDSGGSIGIGTFSGNIGAFSAGSFVEVDSTNMPGLYQLDIPDAALATGVDAVTIAITATGVIDKFLRICLLSVDLRDATDLGLTNLDATVSSRSSHSAADVADSVWTETLADHSAGVGSTAEALAGAGGGGSAPTAAEIYTHFTTSTNADAFKADVSALATQASVDTVDANVDAILVDTNELQTNQNNWLTATGFSTHSAADVADAVWDELQTDHVTAGTFGAYLDSSISGIAAGSAPTAAEIYTHFTTGVNADAFKADTSSLATAANISALNDISASDVYTYFTGLTRADAFKADVASLSTDISTVDTVVDAIKVKTDQLTFTVANQLDSNVLTGAGDDAATIYSYFINGSREDVFKADTTGLATSADVSALNNITSADVYTYFTTAARGRIQDRHYWS